jgi:drebrin-like protein
MERQDCSRVGFVSLLAHYFTDKNHPGNYVELVEGDEGGSTTSPAQPSHMDIPTPAAVAAAPAPAERKAGPTATALYDYEAAGESESCLSYKQGR